MGAYILRVTGETVDTPIGKANVVKFAFKPYGMTTWGEKENNRMKRDSGCYASQRMINNGNHTGLGARLREDGTVDRVYNTGNRAYFFDGWLYEDAECVYDREVEFKKRRAARLAELNKPQFDYDSMPPLRKHHLDGACKVITGKTWDEWKTCVAGTYRPSVDRREYPQAVVEIFAQGFHQEFGREIYPYG